ncbi:MAG: dTMP kinase [Chloroflexota bacterium]
MASGSRPAGTGLFITIEGPDGSGKTTQAERLAAWLAARDVPVHLTREPGGTWLGERLREVLLARTAEGSTPTDALTDALLFNAARRQIVREVIRPALAAGTTVVCARYADSTLAYQGYGAGVSLDRLRTLADFATDGLVPDFTVLLDVPAAEALARKAPDEVTRFESEFDAGFHQRVRAGFLAMAAAEPDRFVVVDATRPIETVTAGVVTSLEWRLGPGDERSEPSPPRVRINT